MHVVVVGCGRVGTGLAVSLEQSGHTVAIIDRRPAAFRRLPADLRAERLIGVGFDRDVLVEAGIKRAEGLAAVTNGDNSNIVIARIARESFGIERVVARIYDPQRAAIYGRLGISTIATVGWTTAQVLRGILPDAPEAEWIDPSAKVSLIERRLPKAWSGKALKDVELAGAARLVALGRLGQASIVTADTIGQDGDVVWVAVAQERLAEFDAHLGSTAEVH